MTRIIFMGDSISDGNRGRTDDPNHIYGHGFIFNVVSKLTAERDDLIFFNRGNSGDGIADLLRRWQCDCLDLQPDWVSLLIGINDVIHDEVTPPDVYEAKLRQLIAATRCRIILGEPFTLDSGNWEKSRWLQVRERVGELQHVVQRVATDTGAVHLPLQQTLEQGTQRFAASHWIWDSVHPTAAGHWLIAQTWLQQFERSETAFAK